MRGGNDIQYFFFPLFESNLFSFQSKRAMSFSINLYSVRKMHLPIDEHLYLYRAYAVLPKYLMSD